MLTEDLLRKIESLAHDAENAARLAVDSAERIGPGADKGAFAAHEFAADMTHRLTQELMSAVSDLVRASRPAKSGLVAT